VFINTAQTIEKQVFTAAHELGHIWKVDKYVAEKCHTENISVEKIINRFAAELLIPEDIFQKSYKLERGKYQNEDGKITVGNMMKVIVALMNQFFVPMKAVVFRCVEVGVLSEGKIPLLLGKGTIPQHMITGKIKEIIRDNGYIQFQNPTNKKWILGLAELLDQAEKLGTVSPLKIQGLREKFGIQPEAANYEQMNKTID
jgi:Zn-dependent peptidase ImmA (M78 family)